MLLCLDHMEKLVLYRYVARKERNILMALPDNCRYTWYAPKLKINFLKISYNVDLKSHQWTSYILLYPLIYLAPWMDL